MEFHCNTTTLGDLLWHYLTGKSASIRAFQAIPPQNPLDRTASNQSSAEHYSVIKTAEVSMLFSFFQVGMIQMEADKNNVKKINQIKGCTQELMFIANENKNKTKKREKERKWSEAQHIRLRI